MAVACSTSAFKTSLGEALKSISSLGFEHVDILAIPQWDHVSAPNLVQDFEKEADRVEGLLEEHSLVPIAMNLGLPATYDRAAEVTKERLEQVRAVSRLMNRLGISMASFYPGYKVEDRDWETVLRDASASIREMLETARGEGVRLSIEPHFATPFQTIEQIDRLLEAVPELDIAYDPSHFTMQEIPLEQTAHLLDRAIHVHLRDAAAEKMQVPTGKGSVDFDWIFRRLKSRGYTGNFSIEYLPGLESGVEPSIQSLNERIRTSGF